MKTIDEIENYLRTKKVSGVMAVRCRNLMKSFATLDAFFSAKREDIEKMYNRLTPENKHGLGNKFWPVFNMALDYYKGDGDDGFEEFARAVVPEEEAPKTDAVLVKMHSYDELKAVVDMMEFCNIEAINFLEIAGFLENVRFRQKKTQEETASGDSDAGKQS